MCLCVCVCVVMAGLTCYNLTAQCATSVQPHPAPESNQTSPGEAASTSRHPHTLPHFRCAFNIKSR